MSDSFDPYYKWLGIPPDDQPANHYRLLGIELFEADTAVIENAADQKMSYVRTFASGPNGRLSQKLLNELAAARLCLLDADKKNTYDAGLREPSDAPAVARPVAAARPARPATAKSTPAVIAVGQPTVVAPQITKPTTTARRSARRRSPPIGLWIAIGFGALVLVGLVVGLIAVSTRDGSGSASELASQQPIDEADKPSTEVETPKPSDDVADNDFQVPPPVAQDTPPRPPVVTRPPFVRSKPFNEDDLFGPDPTERIGPNRIRPRPSFPFRRPPQPRRPLPGRRPTQQPAPVTPDEPTKPAPPDERRQKALREQIIQLYEVPSLRTPEQKSEVAKRMMEQGESNEKMDERFVLLDESRFLATSAGDLKTATNCVIRLSRDFEIDRLSLLAEVVADIKLPQNDGDAHEKVTQVGLVLIDNSIAADRYDLATKIAEDIMTTARRTKSAEWRRRVEEKLRELGKRRRLFDSVRPALARLSENPEDPASNSAVGRYYCFVKGDWSKGLALLSKGDQPQTSRLAQLEASDPKDARTMLGIADGWYDAAQDQSLLLSGSNSLQQQNIQQRALHWYQQVLPQLDGVNAVRVRSRIGQLED